MKKLLVLIPAAAALAAAAAYTAVKAKKIKKNTPEKGTPAPKAAKSLQKGSYSFVSGYKESCELTVTLSCDADKYSFDILDSDFPIYTSDSHVAFLSGEDFGFQLEYAAFYGDEGFAGLCAAEKEKHPDAEKISIAGIESLSYIQGDNIVYLIPADSFSYLLINVIKDKGNDESLEELSREAELLSILNSIEIEKQ